MGRGKKFTSWVAEKINLKDDSALNDTDINKMNDEQLWARNSSIRRSEAAYTLGVVAFTCIGFLYPPAFGAALLNGRQLQVSSNNREHTRKEINRRAEGNIGYQRGFELFDRPGQDIFKGMTFKAVFITIGNGIDGTYDIIHGFGGHSTSGAIVTNPSGKTVVNAAVDQANSQAVSSHPANTHSSKFLDAHPAIADTDKVFHDKIGVIGDNLTQVLSTMTGMDIKSDMSWPELAKEWLNNPHSHIALATQTVIAGGLAEATQFIVIAEAMVEKELEKRDFKRAQVVMMNMQGRDAKVLILIPV